MWTLNNQRDYHVEWSDLIIMLRFIILAANLWHLKNPNSQHEIFSANDSFDTISQSIVAIITLKWHTL